MTDATQAFRATAEKGAAQAKEAFEKMTGLHHSYARI